RENPQYRVLPAERLWPHRVPLLASALLMTLAGMVGHARSCRKASTADAAGAFPSRRSLGCGCKPEIRPLSCRGFQGWIASTDIPDEEIVAAAAFACGSR